MGPICKSSYNLPVDCRKFCHKVVVHSGLKTANLKLFFLGMIQIIFLIPDPQEHTAAYMNSCLQ